VKSRDRNCRERRKKVWIGETGSAKQRQVVQREKKVGLEMVVADSGDRK
jgi:hypothetical protein